eukprot:GDKJ01032973.1.p1 GENE.GDKJ01032973.1~~GDKJ01032973.1.p1  ORF type:complete len:232 (+),score=34.45 GDKJ01032973.1:275-970(+)
MKYATQILEVTKCESPRYDEFIKFEMLFCLDEDCAECKSFFHRLSAPEAKATRMAMPPEHRASLFEAKRLWLEPSDAAFFFQALCDWRLDRDFELHIFYDAQRCTPEKINQNLLRSSLNDFKSVRSSLETLKTGILRHFEGASSALLVDDSESAFLIIDASEDGLWIVDPHLLDPRRVVRKVTWNFILQNVTGMWVLLRILHNGDEFVKRVDWSILKEAIAVTFENKASKK